MRPINYFSIILVVFFISCSKNEEVILIPINENQLAGTYAMLTSIGEVSGIQGNSYLQTVNEYDTTVTNEKAIENTNKGTIASFGDYVFYASFFSSDIKRYRVNDDFSLSLDGELGIPGVADIVVVSMEKGYILQNNFELKEFNPSTFQVTASISLQQYNNKTATYPFSRTGELFVRRSDNKVFIPIHYINNMTFSAIDDSISIAVVDGNTNTLEALITDDRTYSPGMLIGSGGSGFSIDENDDIYITCSAGFGFTKTSSKSPGIIRIKSGTTQIDPTYFFNFDTANIGNCQGLHCAADGVAYTFLRDTDLINSDFSNAVIAAAHVPIQINLESQILVEKVQGVTGTAFLNGLWMKSFEDNTKCYLPVNNTTENAIYELDFSTNTVQKVYDAIGAVNSFEFIK